MLALALALALALVLVLLPPVRLLEWVSVLLPPLAVLLFVVPGLAALVRVARVESAADQGPLPLP